MTILLVLLLLASLLALLVREVALDGYGRRPGPRSHTGC